MSQFKEYFKPGTQLMRPYVEDEDMSAISISGPDKRLKSLVGGYIAVSKDDYEDQWYVSKKFFDKNYAECEAVHTEPSPSKTLHNSTVDGAKKNVSDLVIYGDGDTFKLLCKASSKQEGWMKSTKAMQVPNGCVVQVTTQQGDNVSEALTFVPGVKIHEIQNDKANGRRLVSI